MYFSTVAPSYPSSLLLTLPLTLKSSKLGIGDGRYALTWTEQSVLVHKKIGQLIACISIEKHGNLGLLEEQLGTLSRVLTPFVTASILNS